MITRADAQGSGLGTSSILAACLLAAVGAAATGDVTIDRDALVHAVLRAEQMLTTGGGWQDPTRRAAHSGP